MKCTKAPHDDDDDKEQPYKVHYIRNVVLVVYNASGWLSLFTGLDYWTGILDWTTGLKFFPFLDKIIMWFFKYLTPGDLNYYFLETIEFL